MITLIIQIQNNVGLKLTANLFNINQAGADKEEKREIMEINLKEFDSIYQNKLTGDKLRAEHHDGQIYITIYRGDSFSDIRLTSEQCDILADFITKNIV